MATRSALLDDFEAVLNCLLVKKNVGIDIRSNVAMHVVSLKAKILGRQLTTGVAMTLLAAIDARPDIWGDQAVELKQAVAQSTCDHVMSTGVKTQQLRYPAFYLTIAVMEAIKHPELLWEVKIDAVAPLYADLGCTLPDEHSL